MKSLHNKIFQGGNCIPHEQLQQYANGELSEKEQHNVELHTTDCDLCSEALEGFALLSVSQKDIEKVNKRIDKLVLGQKTGFRKFWMVAASITLLLGISFFYFNSNELGKQNYAENKKVEDPTLIEQDNLQETLIDSSKGNEKNKERPKMWSDDVRNTGTKYNIRRQPTHAGNWKGDKFWDGNNYLYNDQGELIQIKVYKDGKYVGDVPIEDSNSNNLLAENKTKPTAKKAELLADNDLSKIEEEAEEVIEEDNNAEELLDAETLMDEEEIAYVEEPSAPVARTASAFKDNNIAVDDMVMETESSMEENEPLAMSNTSETYELYGFIVKNYENIYSEEIDKDNALSNAKREEVNESVSAMYESADIAQEQNVEEKSAVQQFSYAEYLDETMLLFKEAKYSEVSNRLEVILNHYPNDENATFYLGLAKFRLNKNLQSKRLLKLLKDDSVFIQEANWYIALNEIELNNIKEAKQLLNEIKRENGFYATQAKEKLKNL